MDFIQQYPGRKRIPLLFRTGGVAGVNERKVIVIADPDILDDYLNGPFTEATVEEGTRGVDVRGHTRKLFPGDTGVSVAQHSKTIKKGGGFDGDSVARGKVFTLQKGVVLLERFEISQTNSFRYVGSLRTLRDVISAKRKVRVILVTPSGRRIPYVTAPAA